MDAQKVSRQTKRTWWSLTIKADGWKPPVECPDGVKFWIGQLEKGNESGYLHWQTVIGFSDSIRWPDIVNKLNIKGKCWCTPIICDKVKYKKDTTRRAVNRTIAYCIKDETCVDIEKRFVLGRLRKEPKKRSYINDSLYDERETRRIAREIIVRALNAISRADRMRADNFLYANEPKGML